MEISAEEDIKKKPRNLWKKISNDKYQVKLLWSHS
jgi:hypothetical protein